MEHIKNKINCIGLVEQLLLDHHEGLRQADIARRIGVSPATISRYIRDMTEMYPIYEDDGYYKLNTEGYLNNIKLNIHEAMALSLAMNLVVDRSGTFNPYAVGALRKIGRSIENISPTISLEIKEAAERFEINSRRCDKRYEENLRTLNECWCEGRCALVTHFSSSRQKLVTYKLKILKIRPYATGFSLHLIGYSVEENQLRTLKLSRIKKVEHGDAVGDVAVPMDISKKLEGAWDVWYSEKPPVKVVLKFSPRVASRVKETRWHISEKTQDLEAGWLLWEGAIANPREMVPWVRGWGGDVEVLEPADLRQRIKEELAEWGRMYGEE